MRPTNMNISPASVFLSWTIVYAGLAAFFFMASRRIPGRGHELFAAGLLGFGVLNLLRAAAQEPSLPLLAALAARFTMILSAFGGAIHTHFIALFFREKRVLRHVWVGYAVAVGASISDFIGTITRTGGGLDNKTQVPLAVFVTATFAAHLIFAILLLARSEKRGYKLAKWPLWAIVVLGPFLIFDIAVGAIRGTGHFFGESVVWLYALSIALVQLAELRGSEGLLERATSSLAERTAELQISYAELELMSTELSRKDQLAAVGELAAAIAHEVRNPLAIIMNAGSGLRRKNLAEADRETLLSIVDEEAQRLNQLVAELLRFARPVHAARAPTSLFDICVKLRDEAPPSHAIVVEMLATGTETVLVDSGLFRLALDNLVDNARHAMPDGGTIEVVVRKGNLADGAQALGVEVRDTGAGMSPAEVEKCRRPFYTTRPRGTGLGLSIAERIIEANGGELKIESVLGQGTVVTLLVPLDVGQGSARYPGSKSPSQRRRRLSNPPGTLPVIDPGLSLSPGERTRLSSYTEFEAPPPPSPILPRK